jgi:hypothetical protein
MAAPNCSPAVASRRAKYVDDFRFLTLLGAQHKIAHKKTPTHNIFSDAIPD